MPLEAPPRHFFKVATRFQARNQFRRYLFKYVARGISKLRNARKPDRHAPHRIQSAGIARRVDKRTWLWSVTSLWPTAPQAARTRAVGRRLPNSDLDGRGAFTEMAGWHARPPAPQLHRRLFQADSIP
jgi:hypothetical protein